jgi:hypothetical protein
MTMHVLALMSVRKEGEMVRGLEPVRPADARRRNGPLRQGSLA